MSNGNKKTKLTISGSQKIIKNIDSSKLKGKNTVLIEKQSNNF